MTTKSDQSARAILESACTAYERALEIHLKRPEQSATFGGFAAFMADYCEPFGGIRVLQQQVLVDEGHIGGQIDIGAHVVQKERQREWIAQKALLLAEAQQKKLAGQHKSGRL